MRIHIHIGVHKTATTYIQLVLEASRPVLSAAGIGYLPLKPTRGLLTKRLMDLTPENFSIEDLAAHFFDESVPAKIKGLVISEENLLGHNAETVHSGQLYPAALDRLSRLRALLASHELTAFMAVRSYDDYIASQYCEAMRWAPLFCRFESFLGRMNFETFRWPHLYAGVMAALAPDNIRIWRYEDFRANAEAIIRALAFDVAGPLALDQPDLKPGISQKAMDYLHQIERKNRAEAAAASVRAAEAAFPKAKGFPGFNPWSVSAREQLRQVYDADCAALPDKWLVKPAFTAPQTAPAGAE
jgi:hypothetical protein